MGAHDRRLFLKYLGAGLTGVAASAGLGPIPQARGELPFGGSPAGLPFTPIEPSLADALVLPPRFTSDIVALWGDRLPGTNLRFGYNADFTGFLPIASKDDEGYSGSTTSTSVFLTRKTVSSASTRRPSRW